MDRDSDDDGGVGPSTGGNGGFGPSEELQVDLGLNFDEPLDTDGSSRRIWMVKVPKFLLERWQSVDQDNVELGRLRVYNKKDDNGEDRIAVLLPPAKQGEEPIPTEYFMTIQNKSTQFVVSLCQIENMSRKRLTCILGSQKHANLRRARRRECGRSGLGAWTRAVATGRERQHASSSCDQAAKEA